MALLVSLFATTLLAGLGLALVLLGSAESTLAARDVRAQAAAHAAHAALSLAEAEIRSRSNWGGVLTAGVSVDTCAEPGGFADSSLTPPAPWDGSALDLHALTAKRQSVSHGQVPSGMSDPVWRLFDYGPISRLVPSDARRHPHYVVVWAADGGGGTVLLYATAMGPAEVVASVEATVARGAGGTSLVRHAIRAQP